MGEKRELFNELKEKVDQMVNHSDDVVEVHFIAKLKNKSKLEFNYDEEVEKRLLKGKTIYKPISVFNSIIDMLASIASITFLVLACVFFLNGTGLQNTFITNSFAFWIAYFVFSSVYHLFNRNNYSKNVLFAIKQYLLILSFSVTAFCSLAIYSGPFLSYFAIGIFAAVSIFFTAINTKGGQDASNVVLAIMSFLPLSFVEEDIFLTILVMLMIITAIVPVFFGKNKKDRVSRAKTNGTFAIAVVSLLFVMIGQHLG